MKYKIGNIFTIVLESDLERIISENLYKTQYILHKLIIYLTK
jgi:hypothetical protein